MWPFASGFFPLAECFRGSSVLSFISNLISFHDWMMSFCIGVPPFIYLQLLIDTWLISAFWLCAVLHSQEQCMRTLSSHPHQWLLLPRTVIIAIVKKKKGAPGGVTWAKHETQHMERIPDCSCSLSQPVWTYLASPREVVCPIDTCLPPEEGDLSWHNPLS